MTDPYSNILNSNSNTDKKIIRQELITYEIRNDKMYKIVVTRTFHLDGDYTDTMTEIPLV